MAYNPRSAEWFTFVAEEISASKIAEIVGGELVGVDKIVESVATYSSNQKNSLSYQVGNASESLEFERVVLCDRESAPSVSVASKILVEDPRHSYLCLLSNLKPDFKKTVKFQFDRLGLEAGKSDIHSTAFIEDGVIIGAGCCIEPHVVIKSGTIIGQDTYISSNSVLGTHGPAIYKSKDSFLSYIKLHFGTLQVCQSVEIGNSCVLLKGMLGRTYIGANTIIGNLVHVGHGSEIRDHVWMAAGVTICGHVFMDSHVSVGAGAVIRDNVAIGSNASIGMGSVVIGDVQKNTSVLGLPAKEKSTKMRSGPFL